MDQNPLEQLRRARYAYYNEEQLFHDLIRQTAKQDGVSLRQIAQATMLSHEQIRKICTENPSLQAPARQRNKLDMLKQQKPIITFTSSKGGTGKSVTAYNFALYMASIMREGMVLCIDGDFTSTSIHPANNKQGLLGFLDALDAGLIPASPAQISPFVIHNRDYSNLHLLPQPENPDFIDDVTASDFQNILAHLQNFYDLIVIDAGCEIFLASNTTWVQEADLVCVMTYPDEAILKSTQKMIQTCLNKKLTSMPKLQVIVTNADQGSDINVKEKLTTSFPQFSQSQYTYLGNYTKELVKEQSLIGKNHFYTKEIGQILDALLGAI